MSDNIVDNVSVIVFAVTFVGLPIRVGLLLDAVLILVGRFIVEMPPVR